MTKSEEPTFLDKKQLEGAGYKDSRLWLNKYLSTLNNWDRKEIEKRFSQVADRFLAIWKYPEIQMVNDLDSDEINIFEAEEPKHKKLEYAIFFDQKIEVTQVSKLYLEVFKKLFEIQPETFFTTDIGTRIGLTKSPDKNGLRQPVPINDTYFIESNIDSNGKFERVKQALSIFDFEDELMVRYA